MLFHRSSWNLRFSLVHLASYFSPGDVLCQIFNNPVKGGLFEGDFGGLNHFNNPLLILVFVLQSHAIRLLTKFQNLPPDSDHGGIFWSNH